MLLPRLIVPPVSSPTLDTAVWYLHLRWIAVVGQLLTMAFVVLVLRIALPVYELLIFIGLTACSNGVYWFWLSTVHKNGVKREDRLANDEVIPGLMLVDVIDLTGMLYLSAGIANPFSLFYFVNIAVAGAILTPRWAWWIWGATVAGVTLLLVRSAPLEVLSAESQLAASPVGQPIWTIPKVGFLVSFATCSGVITYFITMLTGELRQREQAIKEAEEAHIRNQQLEGLATLAGGAAHELATPLSTIAVVAKELGRGIEKLDAPPTLLNDVALIRSELDRCRSILDRMTSAAGEAAGERLLQIDLRSLMDEVLVGVRDVHRVDVLCNSDSNEAKTLLPVQALALAIRNLVQNALDASEESTTVEVWASSQPKQWKIQVVDYGTGITPDVLKRLGEPFFTTKEPGKGMGLGVYLTQNVVRRLGGNLSYRKAELAGTIAEVIIPTIRKKS